MSASDAGLSFLVIDDEEGMREGMRRVLQRAFGERPGFCADLAENGEQAIILEGISQPAGKPDPEFAKRLAEAIGKKYADRGYSPSPDQWDEGGLFVFTPHQCIAWTVFTENPTKFEF